MNWAPAIAIGLVAGAGIIWLLTVLEKLWREAKQQVYVDQVKKSNNVKEKFGDYDSER